MYLKDCQYCEQEYTATKSNQKYCSNSCRTRACYERNEYKYVQGHYKSSKEDEELKNKPVEKPIVKKQKEDNLSGFIDATAGTLFGNLLTKLLEDVLTENHDKSSTKGDLYKVVQLIEQLDSNRRKSSVKIMQNQVSLDKKLNLILKKLEEQKLGGLGSLGNLL